MASDETSLAPNKRSGHYALWFSSVIGILASVLAGFYIYSDNSGPPASDNYARAMKEVEHLRNECDEGLGKSRTGRSPPISHALCVQNGNIPALPAHENAIMKVMAIGDWGRDGMCCQRDVANRMEEVAEHWKPEFIINTGDNFYQDGINSPDDPQVASSWSGVYGTLPHLKYLNFVSICGNHDHRGNVGAQLELAKISKTWVMPSLTYFETYAGGGVDISYIDTTAMYYSKDQLRAEFGTDFANSTSGVNDVLAKLEAHLKQSEASWKIVVGHHPIFSTGSHSIWEPECQARMQKLVKPILEKYKVAAYVCGHEHSIEHSVADGVHYFVTGGGSKFREITSHIKENRFGIGKQGFMAYAFEKKVLHAYVVDLAGAILYETRVERPN